MTRLSIRARTLLGLAAGVLSLSTSPLAAQTRAGASQDIPPAAARWWRDITVLADDSLRGRATGTEDYLEAARYVADEFGKAGLEPIGTDGYFQMAHLATARLVSERSGIALVSDGRADTLALGRDATINLSTTTAPHVTGPMVFVGYGLHFPGIRDDMVGTSVRGKVAVYLNRLPSGLSATMVAHSRSGRWEALRAAGAIAAIAISDPPRADALISLCAQGEGVAKIVHRKCDWVIGPAIIPGDHSHARDIGDVQHLVRCVMTKIQNGRK